MSIQQNLLGAIRSESYDEFSRIVSKTSSFSLNIERISSGIDVELQNGIINLLEEAVSNPEKSRRAHFLLEKIDSIKEFISDDLGRLVTLYTNKSSEEDVVNRGDIEFILAKFEEWSKARSSMRPSIPSFEPPSLLSFPVSAQSRTQVSSLLGMGESLLRDRSDDLFPKESLGGSFVTRKIFFGAGAPEDLSCQKQFVVFVNEMCSTAPLPPRPAGFKRSVPGLELVKHEIENQGLFPGFVDSVRLLLRSAGQRLLVLEDFARDDGAFGFLCKIVNPVSSLSSGKVISGFTALEDIFKSEEINGVLLANIIAGCRSKKSGPMSIENKLMLERMEKYFERVLSEKNQLEAARRKSSKRVVVDSSEDESEEESAGVDPVSLLGLGYPPHPAMTDSVRPSLLSQDFSGITAPLPRNRSDIERRMGRSFGALSQASFESATVPAAAAAAPPPSLLSFGVSAPSQMPEAVAALPPSLLSFGVSAPSQMPEATLSGLSRGVADVEPKKEEAPDGRTSPLSTSLFVKRDGIMPK